MQKEIKKFALIPGVIRKFFLFRLENFFYSHPCIYRTATEILSWKKVYKEQERARLKAHSLQRIHKSPIGILLKTAETENFPVGEDLKLFIMEDLS